MKKSKDKPQGAKKRVRLLEDVDSGRKGEGGAFTTHKAVKTSFGKSQRLKLKNELEKEKGQLPISSGRRCGDTFLLFVCNFTASAFRAQLSP